MTFDIDKDNKLLKAHPDGSNSVVIPSNVLSINDGTNTEYAFIEFKNTKFSLSFEPNSKITRIGKWAFFYCKQLTSIDFSNSKYLKSIGEFAFYLCSSLTTLHFPSSLESLDHYGSFHGCSGITEVIFPDDSKIRTIAKGTFWGTKMTQFRVPASCTFLDGETFAYTNVERFTVQEGSNTYKEYDGSIFSNDFKTLIVHRKSGKLSLPPETTSIGYISLSNLKIDIKLGKSITSFDRLSFFSFQGKRITILGIFDCISDRMFEECYNLIEVKFFNEVNSIEGNSFQYCNKLRRIEFVYPVKSIVKSAFPDINKICFYGEVSSIREQIKDIHINECKIFFNTCIFRRQRCNNSNLLFAVVLLIYS